MTSKARKLLAEARTYLEAADKKQARADADRWAAAERMWIANREEGATQQEIADALDLARATVNRYIQVWKARSNSELRPDQSFTDAYYEVVGGVQKSDKKDQWAAARALRGADERTLKDVVASLPRERQVAVARAVLSDPKTAEAVHRDPTAAPVLRRASAKIAQEAEHAATERQRERAPRLVNQASVYQIAGMLAHARRDLTHALDAMRNIELDDDSADMLLDEARDVETRLGWVVSFLESGDLSFARALNRLLEEGE